MRRAPNWASPFPTSIEALLAMGPDFLTDAFRASGVLANDNAVVAITGVEEFFGGGMGRKLLLTVAYRTPSPDLHCALFAKFPRDFGDPLRDLFTPIMASEVRFALLSRQPDFPIEVARCYFADYDAALPSGLLITERVAFGHDGIEPAHDKCLDDQLGDPYPYYHELTRAMATLAARQKTGQLGDLETSFPYRPNDDDGSRIPYDRAGLDRKIDALAHFATDAPQLLQAELGDAGFIEGFAAEACLALELEDGIRAYLAHDRDYVALCHWNMNIDNAWFRRDEAGGLHAGLLDWGSVGQMNMAQAFFGMTCAAEIDFLNTHRADLLRHLVVTYRAEGGPAIDFATLDRMVKLATALLGLAWILDAPSVIAQQLPTYATASDRHDPMIRDDFLVRAQLQILNNFLNAWASDGIGDALRAFAADHPRA